MELIFCFSTTNYDDVQDVNDKNPQDVNDYHHLRNSFHEQAKNHMLHVCQQALTMLDHALNGMA